MKRLTMVVSMLAAAMLFSATLLFADEPATENQAPAVQQEEPAQQTPAVQQEEPAQQAPAAQQEEPAQQEEQPAQQQEQPAK